MADSSRTDLRHQPIHLHFVESREQSPATLPSVLTSMVGRQKEAQAVADLLRLPEVRLVTLTGPGGVGKTRLALRLAADLDDELSSGVAFVSLAAVTDPAFVESAIAYDLGIREAGGKPIGRVLESTLRGRRMLLVLDNFEQVVDAAPRMTALLAACPELTMLVTSRTALRVHGEQEFPVPPLATPELERLPLLADLERTDAVALFVQRAKAVRPDFALTPESAPVVAEICHRLDGLPLAIELAAARSKVLSLAALSARLTNRLDVLTSGPQDQPARLQTMRAAIDWSYDLLTEDERALFRRLAVFVGGFTMDAAEHVATAGTGLDQSVLDGLSSLVDKSLLAHVHEGDHEPRFWMLETIREYGLERLLDAGEEPVTRRRHAAWCSALAEHYWPNFQRRHEAAKAVTRLAAEHDNTRAALTWLERAGDRDALQRLAGAAFLFWYVEGHLREGLSWLERSLQPDVETSPASRARALLGAGMLAHYLEDDARAVPYLEQSLARYRALADLWGQAFSLAILGIVAEDSGGYDRAAELLTESLDHARAAGDTVTTGLVLFHLGIVAWGQGELERADTILNDALIQQRTSGDLDYGAAESLAFLGVFACERGDIQRSAEMQRESLSLHLGLGSKEVLAVNIANVAILAAATRRPNQAVRLYAAAREQREAIGNPFKLPERAAYERSMAEVKAVLGEAELAAAWDAGRLISLSAAVAEAIAVLDGIERQAPVDSTPPRLGVLASDRFSDLTARELEVLHFLVDGRSDREIAHALFISPRTAQAHVAHIFTKLGVNTRAAAVAAALRSDQALGKSQPQ
jgi:predicted ATPase/DNA-binding CsgD family transcriptional regulator